VSGRVFICCGIEFAYFYDFVGYRSCSDIVIFCCGFHVLAREENPFQYRMNDHCCDYDRTPGLTLMVIINDGYYY
jgi:hypothetical protein